MLSLASAVFGCCDLAHAYLSEGEMSALGIVSLALAVGDIALHHWENHRHLYK